MAAKCTVNSLAKVNGRARDHLVEDRAAAF